MKKRYILLLLFCLTLVGVSAQTLEEARAFYNQGQIRESQTDFPETSLKTLNRQMEIITYGTAYVA